MNQTITFTYNSAPVAVLIYDPPDGSERTVFIQAGGMGFHLDNVKAGHPFRAAVIKAVARATGQAAS